MADSFPMQNLEPLQKLSGDFLGIRFCPISVTLDVVAQISMFDVLHCEEGVVHVFVPAKELYKQVLVLNTY